MSVPPRRRPRPLALTLVMAGLVLAGPARGQEAPAPIRRNVGGYPVSGGPDSSGSQPRPLLPQTVAPVPGSPAAAPRSPAPAAPARTTRPAKPATPPAASAPKTAPKPARPATAPAPTRSPAGQPPPVLRTTPADPSASARPREDARPLAATGLRATTLPPAGTPVPETRNESAAAAPPLRGANPEPARRTGGSKWRVDPKFLPALIAYDGPEKPGTIVIDTEARYLYLVEPDGQARRYGIGVGRPGFEWAGQHRVTRKAEWPDWRPPPEMRARQPSLPAYMAGGPRNPLGARALYLGSTLYRIHGSNEPWSIGRAVSSGCIRMRNEDVSDLYDRVAVGTTVVVR